MLVVEGFTEGAQPAEEVTDDYILNYVKNLIDKGIDKKSAIKQTAQELNIQKRTVYSLVTEAFK